MEVSMQKDGSFWKELESKINEIGQRNKKKRRNRVTAQNSPRPKQISRCDLDESYHQVLEEEQKLTNRLKYLEMGHEKQMKTLQLARSKFQRVKQIRNQSLRQKQQCKEKIEELKTFFTREATSKASRIRQERKRITASVLKVREQNEKDAKEVRSLSQEIQMSLKEDKEKDIQKNKEMVQKAHANLEKSRTFQVRRFSQQQERGKMQHQAYLQQKIRFNNAKQRKNSILKQKLQQSLLACQQEREKCIEELRQYTSQLGQHFGTGDKLMTLQSTAG